MGISGGTVEVCGGRFAAGIGTGDKAKGTCDVNISGGSTLSRTDPMAALANLGHYTHPWLAQQNHWTVDQDYTCVELAFPEMNKVDEAVEALKAYDNAGVVEGKEHIERTGCSCRFDTLSALEVNLTPKKGESFGACTAKMDGHEATRAGLLLV